MAKGGEFFGGADPFAKRVCVLLTPSSTAEIVLHFFFGATGAKKKLTKRNADTWGYAPHAPTTFWKRWTKTLINDPFSKVFGGADPFCKRVCVLLTPFHKAEVSRHFFFDTRGAKKKLTKRNAVTWATSSSWRVSPTRNPATF